MLSKLKRILTKSISQIFDLLSVTLCRYFTCSMPYRRRYRRRRRRGYGRKRKRVTLRKTARAVYRLKNAIEHKSIYTQTTVSDISHTAWSINQLFLATLGTEQDDRIGDSVFIKSMQLHAEFTYTGDNNLGTMCRMVIFLAKKNLFGGTIGESSLFDLNDAVGTPITPVINTHKSWTNRYNLRTLYDKVHVFGPRSIVTNETYAGGYHCKHVKLNIPVNFKQIYARSGTAIREGNLLFCFITNSSGSNLQIRYCPRIVYTDS